MKPNSIKTSLAGLALLVATGTSAQAIPSYANAPLPCSSKLFQGNHLWLDHNNDGKMDLLVKGRDLNDGWAIKALLLTNKGESFDMTDLGDKIELPETYQKVLAAIDYNNDGYADLLYAAYGNAKLYRNTKGNSFKEVTNFQIEDLNNEEETLYAGLIGVADFDNDGFQDIATFDGERNIVLYRNNGGDGTFSKVENSLGGGSLAKLSSGTLAWGDYDNDGRPDLLVSGWGENGTYAVLYRNLGEGKFEKLSIDQSEGGVVTGTQKGQITWVDIDGDGRQDIFMSGETFINGNWDKSSALYLNTGNPASPFRKLEADLPKVQKSGVDWADLNGDGKMDLVYAGEGDGTLTVMAINQGGNAFNVQTSLVQGFRSGASIGLYDYNNDGHIDLCAMGYGEPATFGLFRHNGNTTRNTAPTAPSELKATAGEGYVSFSWKAATDAQTATEALRYNLFVRLKNDEIISLVPANLTTGSLSLGNCNNALTALGYTLRINAADIESWGVQTIDQGKLASTFATSTEIGTGIGSIEADSRKLPVDTHNGRIYLRTQEPARVIVYDTTGQLVADETLQPGTCLQTVFNRNIYIVEVRNGQQHPTTKLTIE